jgi:hypothetical protein
MKNTLLSFSAVAGLVLGLTVTAAQAAPTSGLAAHVNPSLVQQAGWDGDRGRGGHRRWWHRHRGWDRGHWRRRHYGDHGGWRGDRGYDHDRGHYREHRRDWR